jgi:hypothetical protein
MVALTQWRRRREHAEGVSHLAQHAFLGSADGFAAQLVHITAGTEGGKLQAPGGRLSALRRKLSRIVLPSARRPPCIGGTRLARDCYGTACKLRPSRQTWIGAALGC